MWPLCTAAQVLLYSPAGYEFSYMLAPAARSMHQALLVRMGSPGTRGTPSSTHRHSQYPEGVRPRMPGTARSKRRRYPSRSPRSGAQSWFRWHVHSAYFDCPQTLIMPPQPKPRIAARCEARAGSAAVVLASYCERVRCVARATVGSCDLSVAPTCRTSATTRSTPRATSTPSTASGGTARPPARKLR